jgi:chitinase
MLNLVLLMMEMRERFNKHPTRLGISVALAPDFEYLRHFDVKAMEPFVDWFGFMVRAVVKSIYQNQQF